MACRSAITVCSHCRRLLPYHRRLLVRAPRLGLGTSLRLLSASVPEVTEPIPAPPPDAAGPVYPEKIRELVHEISQLTLVETAQLNELLKSTLNIPDTPMMTMGAMAAVGGAAVQQEEAEEKEEQTEFTVKLVKYTDTSKVKLIKEVKVLMEDMNLVQAKKFVEGVPQVIKSEVNKEEAERLKAALEAAGGVVEVE